MLTQFEFVRFSNRPPKMGVTKKFFCSASIGIFHQVFTLGYIYAINQYSSFS